MATLIDIKTKKQLFEDKMAFSQDTEILINALSLIEELVQSESKDVKIKQLQYQIEILQSRVERLIYSNDYVPYQRYSITV
jgi:hypothetical protein